MKIIVGLMTALFALTAHAQQLLQLKPTPKTIAWGYYDASTPPVMRIKSGDTVEIQTLITSSPSRLEGAGVKPEDVEQPLRDIWKEVTNKGPGGHILTGPIFIEGAEPGDVLEVRIKEIKLAIPYAYNGFSPGRGYIPEDFPYARMRIIPLDAKTMTTLRRGDRDSAAAFLWQHRRRAAGDFRAHLERAAMGARGQSRQQRTGRGVNTLHPDSRPRRAVSRRRRARGPG